MQTSHSGLLCLGRLFHVQGTVRSFVSEEERGEHTNTNFNSSRHGLETCLNGHRAVSLTVCPHSPRQRKSVIFIAFQSRKLWFAELKTQRSHAPGFHLQGVSRIGKPRDTEKTANPAAPVLTALPRQGDENVLRLEVTDAHM